MPETTTTAKTPARILVDAVNEICGAALDVNDVFFVHDRATVRVDDALTFRLRYTANPALAPEVEFISHLCLKCDGWTYHQSVCRHIGDVGEILARHARVAHDESLTA